jgi:hypothetical protein
MNRQIVAFLSLFSLVLVLSIYYVMLPFANPASNDKNANVDIEDSTELYFASLLEKKNNEYEIFISEQTEIVASADASGEEKAQALAAIEQRRAILEKEEQAINLILEYGFDEAYVEIVDGTVEILVAIDEEYTTLDIAQIMIIAFNQFGRDYVPKVKVYQETSNQT